MSQDIERVLKLAFPGEDARYFSPMTIGNTPASADAGAQAILDGIKTTTSSPFWDWPTRVDDPPLSPRLRRHDLQRPLCPAVRGGPRRGGRIFPLTLLHEGASPATDRVEDNNIDTGVR
jgi:hypothetical protein